MPRIIPLPDDPGAPTAATPDAPVQAPAPSAAAPNAPVQASPSATPPRIIPTDENGNPIPGWGNGNLAAGAKFLGRGLVRAIPEFGDFAANTEGAVDRLIRDKVGPEWFAAHPTLTKYLAPGAAADAPTTNNATDYAVNAVNSVLPIQMDPDAGWLMKHADPFASTVATAGLGGIVKGVTAAPTVAKMIPGVVKGIFGELATQGTNVALSTAAGEGVKAAGGNDAEQGIASFLASLAHPGVQGYGTQKLANAFKAPNTPQRLADYEALNIKPTFGMLADDRGKLLEANLAANPLVGGGIKARIDDVAGTLDKRISQEAGNVGYGGTPLEQARTPAAAGSDLIHESQGQQARLDAATTQSYNDLRDKIGTTQPDLQSLGQQIADLAVHPDTPAEWTPALQARADRINMMAGRGGTYSALQDSRSLLGQSLAGSDALTGKPYKAVYGQMTDAMRDTADRAGAAANFDAANEQARVMHQEQFPPLQKLGGELSGENPNTGSPVFRGAPAAGEADTIFGHAASTQRTGDPELMRQLDRQLPSGATGRALADIIRRAGVSADGKFRLDRFAPGWNQVNEDARAAIGARSADTPATLDRVGRVGTDFLRKPNPSGLTDTLGLQGAVALLPGNFLTKSAATLALLHGLNSNSMLNAMAGRGGTSDILLNYLKTMPIQQENARRFRQP